MKWLELKRKIGTLNKKQLNQDVFVSEGCDQNGNATFFSVDEITKVGEGVIDAAANFLLKDKQAVILFKK